MIKQEINQSVNHVSCLRPTELHLCCIGNESSEIFLLQFFSAKYETITCDWKQWLCTALSLKTSVTNSMLKWEKLFSGNCTQFSSQLLNCPRWGAHKSLSNPENGPMWKLLLHPNSCWRPSCTRLVDVEALETKLTENVLMDSHDLYADTEQTDQGLVGEYRRLWGGWVQPDTHHCSHS